MLGTWDFSICYLKAQNGIAFVFKYGVTECLNVIV